jgi:hypothetical protein
MANLADLLRYKEEIEIRDPRTDKLITTVWIRVLGDLDLTIAYKAARIASAEKRLALRDPESVDYKDEVLGVVDLTDEEKIDIIKTSRLSSIVAEATIAVTRPELPRLNEVAVEPDAATLEELEKLDKVEVDVEAEYQKKIDEYITLRTEELGAQLLLLTPEELLHEAKIEVSNLVPFSLFIQELNAQKIFLGTYEDKECTKKAFEKIEDFKQLPKPVQDDLISAMNNLEISGPVIKN